MTPDVLPPPLTPTPAPPLSYSSLIDKHIVMFAHLLHLAQVGFEIFHKNSSCAVKRGIISNNMVSKEAGKFAFSGHVHYHFIALQFLNKR